MEILGVDMVEPRADSTVVLASARSYSMCRIRKQFDPDVNHKHNPAKVNGGRLFLG